MAMRRALARFVLARADAFAAESELAFPLARAAGLSADAPVAAIHTNPRDTLVFHQATLAEQAAARRGCGLPAEGPGVGFMGRLVPEKGILELLDAWARLPNGGTDGAFLAVAGSGPLEAEVRRRCRELGAFWLGSLEYPAGVAEFLGALDVAVVPSYATPEWVDQSPRVVLEALPRGLIVVGTDSGAIPGMLGEHGIVVPEHDADALARGIEAAVARRAVQSTAASAAAYASSRWSAEAVADQMLGLWHRALGDAAGSAGNTARGSLTK
jgi:glycosyltransferase involved in cell wall biosynthesis